MKMNHILMVIFILSLSVAAISCSNNKDGNNLLNTTPYSQEYGIVEKQSKGSYRINLDNGKIAYPQSSILPSSFFENNMRIKLIYTILDDSFINDDSTLYVQIEGAEIIPVKEVINYTSSKEKEFGHDPIHIENKPWITNNLITFEYLYGGGVKDHSINLVLISSDIKNHLVTLELRHNAYNDPDNYKKEGAISFNLADTFPNMDFPVTLQISYNSYDGDQHFEFIYSPSPES